MRTRRCASAWLSGAMLLTACGGTSDDAVPGAGAVDERSCPDVIESLEEPNQVRAETFGGGPAGREAVTTIVETVRQRPDCFSDAEVEFATDLAETLPSESEAAAIEAAEDACDGPGGEFSTSGPGDVAFDSPEEALTGGDFPQPEGVAERASEADGLVEFDYHDDAGVYRGWVMVEEAESGWYAKRGIICGPDTDE